MVLEKKPIPSDDRSVLSGVGASEEVASQAPIATKPKRQVHRRAGRSQSHGNSRTGVVETPRGQAFRRSPAAARPWFARAVESRGCRPSSRPPKAPRLRDPTGG